MIKMLNKIIDKFPDNEFIKYEDFDSAVIGMDFHKKVLIYSLDKIIVKLISEVKESELSGTEGTDALDYFYSNIECLNFGLKTPIICYDLF